MDYHQAFEYELYIKIKSAFCNIHLIMTSHNIPSFDLEFLFKTIVVAIVVFLS